VCNAVETVLIDRSVAHEILPRLVEALQSRGVEVRGCEETRALAPGVTAATGPDWETEYLDLILAVKVVDGFEQAVQHIGRYGTKHSEAIITRDPEAAARFQRVIDAACVYVNASTRFTDGSQFGFGAEIGISTQKLHARGPMGLRELNTYKYVVDGAGQIRE
jgi:glutamate-5-semialdehyde dehydrogenase